VRLGAHLPGEVVMPVDHGDFAVETQGPANQGGIRGLGGRAGHRARRQDQHADELHEAPQLNTTTPGANMPPVTSKTTSMAAMNTSSIASAWAAVKVCPAIPVTLGALTC